MLKKIVYIMLALTFAAGCSKFGGKMDPKSVAEKFWSYSKAGNIEKAKDYCTKASASTLQEDKDKSRSGTYTLGEAQIEGDKATIPTTVSEEGTTLQLQTILVKEDGKWKVDVNQTTMTMFGGAMEQMFKAMSEGMGTMVKSAGSSMGQAMEGIEQGMQKFGEQMGKAMGEGVKQFGKTMEEAGKNIEGKLEEAKATSETPAAEQQETTTPQEKPKTE